MDKQAADAHIRKRSAAERQRHDRDPFIEIVETDLLNLHERNIAHARLAPEQFRAWQSA